MQNTTDTRSLAAVLETLAYHVAEMYVTPAGKTFTAGLSYGDEVAMVEVKIEAGSGCFALENVNDLHKVGSTINVWDRCTVNGISAGNRCGARNEMMKVYAPIVALAAAAETARTEAA